MSTWAVTISRNYTFFLNSENFRFTCPCREWGDLPASHPTPPPPPPPYLSVRLASSSPLAALGGGKAEGPGEEAAACPAAWEPRRQSPTACLEAWGRPQLARPQQTLSEFSANSSFSCLRGPSLGFPLCPQNRSRDKRGRGAPPALMPLSPVPLSQLQGFPLSKLSAHERTPLLPQTLGSKAGFVGDKTAPGKGWGL